VLAAAQALATSAVGDLLNKGSDPDALHKAADAIAEQICAALHKRIDEGPKPDW
jgi:regulator of RNase E activity RraB